MAGGLLRVRDSVIFVVDADHMQKGSFRLQEQSVTLTAGMWPEPTASSRGWTIAADRLPILAAVFCGAALLVALLCAFLLYRCCIMPRRDKHFCFRQSERSSNGTQVPPAFPNQTAVFAEPTSYSGYTNKVVVYPAAPSNPWPKPASHGRPMSQVEESASCIYGEIVPKSVRPVISEFSAQNVQYASSSVLDETTRDDFNIGEHSLKSRSLPTWMRSKPRPLSTEDGLNELYAKVNFSKKRKNRMRNDEAAIIALSKSNSQFLNKDTDSLVNNEAIIVYDERTAL